MLFCHIYILNYGFLKILWKPWTKMVVVLLIWNKNSQKSVRQRSKKEFFFSLRLRKWWRIRNFNSNWVQLKKLHIKNVMEHFLWNTMAENYRDLVTKLIQSYQKMGCNTSLKIHFPFFHQTLAPFVMNSLSVSTRIFYAWENGNKERSETC